MRFSLLTKLGKTDRFGWLSGSFYRAFTLIELLIVVAIVAILAVIGIPNFLEAQVRAKVARVQNDMRACTTGLEAYKAENGNYPHDYFEDDWKSWSQLTTPIPFLDTIFIDIFSEKYGPRSPFDYGTQYERPTESQQNGWGAYKIEWAIVSPGPDRKEQWDWATFGETGYDLQLQIKGSAYDPTNGTMSPGDLVRTNRGVEK